MLTDSRGQRYDLLPHRPAVHRGVYNLRFADQMNTQPDTSTLEGKIAVMQAAKGGKKIVPLCTRSSCRTKGGKKMQFQDGSCWITCDATGPVWNWQATNYRIHPDDLNPKKLRAWRPEEIPTGAVLRRTLTHEDQFIILWRAPDGKLSLSGHGGSEWNSIDLMAVFEYQVGPGTWLPCGVLE